MKKRTIVPFIGLGALLVGALYWVTGSHDSPSTAPARGSNDELSALKSEVAELREAARKNARGVSALRVETDRMARAAATVSVAPEPDPQPPLEQRAPARDSAERLAWEAERQVMIAATEADFQSEARDTEWSSKTASSIRDLATKHGAAHGTLRDVDCRSKTCRVEVTENPEAAADLHQFLVDCSMVFPAMVADHVIGADNTSSYVMYFKSGA